MHHLLSDPLPSLRLLVVRLRLPPRTRTRSSTPRQLIGRRVDLRSVASRRSRLRGLLRILTLAGVVAHTVLLQELASSDRHFSLHVHWGCQRSELGSRHGTVARLRCGGAKDHHHRLPLRGCQPGLLRSGTVAGEAPAARRLHPHRRVLSPEEGSKPQPAACRCLNSDSRRLPPLLLAATGAIAPRSISG